MNIDAKKHNMIQLILCIAMFVFSIAELILSITLVFNKNTVVIVLVSIFAIALASIVVLSIISTYKFANKKVEIKEEDSKENLEIEDVSQLKIE